MVLVDSSRFSRYILKKIRKMTAMKIRWGDTLDEDDSLPTNTVVGPDKQGIKTITIYKKNDKGETVKMVTKTRVSRVERKIYEVC